MRRWKKAKKQQKQAEAADARAARHAGLRKDKVAGKREAVGQRFRSSAGEPTRVCVDVSAVLPSEADASAKVASGMPLRVGVTSRPYFPTELIMKLNHASTPSVYIPSSGSGHIGLAIDKLGAVLEPVSINESLHQAPADCVTTGIEVAHEPEVGTEALPENRHRGRPLSFNDMFPYLTAASEPCKVVSEIAGHRGKTTPTHNRAFQDSRVPYW
jgi:hypothetical protein